MKLRNVFIGLLVATSLIGGAQTLNTITAPTTLLAQNNTNETAEPAETPKSEKISSSRRIDKDVLVNSGLQIVMKDFDFDMNFYIVDFEVNIVTGGFVETERWRTSGQKPAKNYAKFNNRQKSLLKKARRGDKVAIENIKVKGEDGSIRMINPIILKVL